MVWIIEQSHTEEEIVSLNSRESKEALEYTGNSSVVAKRTRLSVHQLVTKFLLSSASSLENEKLSDTREEELSNIKGAGEIASTGDIKEDINYSINCHCNKVYHEER